MGLIVSKGQCQGQVRSPNENVACCIYGSFGTQNATVAFIFRFDPRKGQYKVKLGKNGKNSKPKKSSKNMPILSSSVSESQKN